MKDLLVLHGLPGQGSQWASLRRALPSYNVITPTFRGFEHTAASDGFPSTQGHARQIVEWCGEDAANSIVVAWSFACHPLLFAMAFLDFCPGRAILIEPSADTYLNRREKDAFGADAAAAFGPLLARLHDVDDEGLAQMSFEATGSATDWRDLTAARRRPFIDGAAALRCAFVSGAIPARINARDLATVNVPIDVIVGEDTRQMFSLAGRELARILPTVQLRIIKGANHLWPITRPRELADLIHRIDTSAQGDGANNI